MAIVLEENLLNIAYIFHAIPEVVIKTYNDDPIYRCGAGAGGISIKILTGLGLYSEQRFDNK